MAFRYTSTLYVLLLLDGHCLGQSRSLPSVFLEGLRDGTTILKVGHALVIYRPVLATLLQHCVDIRWSYHYDAIFVGHDEVLRVDNYRWKCVVV